jgi:hypothetical protein
MIDGQLNWIKGTNTTPIRKLEDGRLSAASSVPNMGNFMTLDNGESPSLAFA